MQIRLSGSLFQGVVCLVALLGLSACSDSTEPVDQPAILLLNPRGVPSGYPGFQLNIYAENLGPNATVLWNGEPRESFLISENVVVGYITAEDVATNGIARVAVTLADGKTSSPTTFTIGEYLEPAMTQTSVTPAQGTLGAGDTEVTITGTGFIRGMAAFLDFSALQTTWISSTTIRAVVPAAYLEFNSVRDIRIGFPGVWVANAGFDWEVVAAVPVISGLSPAAASAGSDDQRLQVLGSGFGPNSTVLVNGAERTTTFVNGGELGVTLTAADLAAAGTLAITVTTPPPGGGMSPAANFTVTNEPPMLAPLPLAGVTAGGPGFTLVVHGQHFIPGTVVRWNGVERPTLFRSGRRLMATISAADVAAPGTVSITVSTPGFPASSPQTLTIHPIPSATVTDIRSVALPANWLTTDPVSGRLFATVPGSVAVYGNTVTEIDPVAASILTSVFVGSQPGPAEVSDDGQYLYVGLDGAQAVRRVSLPSLTPGLQFSLGTFGAEEVHVMPGHSQTVAISRRDAQSSPSHAGLYIYDDGVARGLFGPGHTGSNTFGWTRDGSRIYGYNFESTEFGLRRVDVKPEGASEVWFQGGLISGFYVRVHVVGDQIYGGDGSVVDGDLRERLGTCNMFGWMTVDRTLGRAFYWADGKIRVCELATYQSLGEITIPGIASPHPAERRSLVRWGSDGLALGDGAKIYLIRTPLAAH